MPDLDLHRIRPPSAALNETTYNSGLVLPVELSGKWYRITAGALLASVAASGLMQAPIIDRTLVTAPGTPNAGDRYVTAGQGGGWAGITIGTIVEWSGTVWTQTVPVEGMLLLDKSVPVMIVRTSSGWTPVSGGGGTTLHWLQSVVGMPPGDPDDYLVAEATPIPVDIGIDVLDDGELKRAKAVAINFIGGSVLVEWDEANNRINVTTSGAGATLALGQLTIAGQNPLIASAAPDEWEFAAGTYITLTTDTGASPKKLTFAVNSSSFITALNALYAAIGHVHQFRDLSDPHRFAAPQFIGKPVSSQRLFIPGLPDRKLRLVTNPVTGGFLQGSCYARPTANTDFLVKKTTDGGATTSDVGTLRLNTSGVLSEVSGFGSNSDIAENEWHIIEAPASPDATAANIVFSIRYLEVAP